MIMPERHVIPALRVELGIPEGAPIVGAVGRLVAEKGYRELFNAVPSMRVAVPGTVLLVIGGPDPEKWDAIRPDEIRVAAEHGVVFTGWRDDVRDLLALMDVFVLPSWREGMPRSAIEAAAMSRAMVLSDVRGCREVARDRREALLVPPRDPGRLTAAIIELLRVAALSSYENRAISSGVLLIDSSGAFARAAGAVYTTGSFTGTYDADPGPGVFNLTTAGERAAFVSKLDAAGNFVWAGAIAGAAVSLTGLAAAFAQETRSMLFGRVLDPTGSVVVGATVVVRNADTGVALNFRTNESGYYEANLLLPGNYEISAEMEGFKKLVRRGVTLPVASRIEINLPLDVGGVTESVSVTADAPLLETSAVSSACTLAIAERAAVAARSGAPTSRLNGSAPGPSPSHHP